MISVKTKNKFFVILISVFISESCLAQDAPKNCSFIGKNKVCLFEYTDNYGENSYHLKVGNTEFYKISYYNNARLKKINEKI